MMTLKRRKNKSDSPFVDDIENKLFTSRNDIQQLKRNYKFITMKKLKMKNQSKK